MTDTPTVDLDFPLAGKTAVVTGAGSGIGAAIAEAYVAKGMRVALVDLSQEAAARLTVRLGAAAKPYACDVSDAAAVEATAAAVWADLGGVDVLVNSAGVVMLAPAEQLETAAWDTTLAVNLSGTFYMAQAIGRRMLEGRGGKIINLASQAASVALFDHVAYCASKFGVVGMTKVLASEWAGRGVTVNAISPTVVLTELGRKAWDGPKGDALKELIPTGRFAEPEEIAATAVFLASAAADMINGVDLLVDGGYTIR
jgi:D-threitol dehydrogenase (NAD+)